MGKLKKYENVDRIESNEHTNWTTSWKQKSNLEKTMDIIIIAGTIVVAVAKEVSRFSNNNNNCN